MFSVLYTVYVVWRRTFYTDGGDGDDDVDGGQAKVIGKDDILI